MIWLVVLFFSGLWVGLQNALTGGGFFITLPVLILSGMLPLQANITSGLTSRSLVTGVGRLSLWALLGISIAGGALGGLLLLQSERLAKQG